MLDKSIQIGIVGLGLIGGSIAKTLSKKGYKAVSYTHLTLPTT